MKTRSFIFIFIGLLIVLAYSRLFGMGELWQAVMGDNFNRPSTASLKELKNQNL